MRGRIVKWGVRNTMVHVGIHQVVFGLGDPNKFSMYAMCFDYVFAHISHELLVSMMSDVKCFGSVYTCLAMELNTDVGY